MFLGMIGGGVLSNRITENSTSDKGFLGDLSKDINVFFGTLLGIVIGGIFGAATGASFDRPKYINFETRTIHQKIEVLIKLINEN